ncbi:hypothetical protein [Spirochaeta africana]|uniref:Uncharacterized protein n=1 Tax=Spirochaeta africana (strain ATCC 700263 / DSM 8902 / Z-7692) TaxID=889378 RepID=H9UK52_SPIAZ|nr:hypothetical protein [Spirochaeta africana]AFG37895.1 hypothetical protein Spiaf_1838 [Spirochaeta africana DSM 8902]
MKPGSKVQQVLLDRRLYTLMFIEIPAATPVQNVETMIRDHAVRQYPGSAEETIIDWRWLGTTGRVVVHCMQSAALPPCSRVHLISPSLMYLFGQSRNGCRSPVSASPPHLICGDHWIEQLQFDSRGPTASSWLPIDPEKRRNEGTTVLPSLHDCPRKLLRRCRVFAQPPWYLRLLHHRVGIYLCSLALLLIAGTRQQTEMIDRDLQQLLPHLHALEIDLEQQMLAAAYVQELERNLPGRGIQPYTRITQLLAVLQPDTRVIGLELNGDDFRLQLVTDTPLQDIIGVRAMPEITAAELHAAYRTTGGRQWALHGQFMVYDPPKQAARDSQFRRTSPGIPTAGFP